MYITAARHRKSSESGGKRNASKVQRHRRTAQETGQGGQGFLPLVCGTAGRGFGEGLHAFHCRALRDEQKCQASDRRGQEPGKDCFRCRCGYGAVLSCAFKAREDTRIAETARISAHAQLLPGAFGGCGEQARL